MLHELIQEAKAVYFKSQIARGEPAIALGTLFDDFDAETNAENLSEFIEFENAFIKDILGKNPAEIVLPPEVLKLIKPVEPVPTPPAPVEPIRDNSKKHELDREARSTKFDPSHDHTLAIDALRKKGKKISHRLEWCQLHPETKDAPDTATAAQQAKEADQFLEAVRYLEFATEYETLNYVSYFSEHERTAERYSKELFFKGEIKPFPVLYKAMTFLRKEVDAIDEKIRIGMQNHQSVSKFKDDPYRAPSDLADRRIAFKRAGDVLSTINTFNHLMQSAKRLD